MGDPKEKDVYILGAGFSMPLGGPGFDELLTTKSHASLTCFQEKNLLEGINVNAITGLSNLVHKLSRIDLVKSQSLYQSLRIRNVEEILELIDYAESMPGSVVENEVYSSISHYLPSSVKDSGAPNAIQWLGRTLKQRIAFETSQFLNELPKNSERWICYERWFSTLRPTDSIFTFNYDKTIETIASRSRRSYQFDTRNGYPIYVHQKNPPLFKLHGSCDWTMNDKLEFNEISHGEPAVIFRNDICIGTPGLAKRSLGEVQLSDAWLHLKLEIEEATRVAIIGYRMPETDTLALQRITDAIAESKSTRLQVDIVLGPDAERFPARRIQAILSQAIGVYRDSVGIVNALPMYAQEYLLQRYRQRASENLSRSSRQPN